MTQVNNVQRKLGIISEGNSFTSESLSAFQDFTGEWEECYNSASISVIGNSTDNIFFYGQFSMDGVTVEREISWNDGNDNSIGIHNIIPVAKYFRLRVLDAGFGTVINVQTIYHQSSRIALPTSSMEQNLGQYSDVLNTRSVLTAVDDSGVYRTIGCSNNSRLITHIDDPLTSFGELRVSDLTAQIQLSFIYNVNSDLVNEIITGIGSASSTDNQLRLSTGASTSSSIEIQSKRLCKYRPGQGCICRFSAVYTNGLISGQQQIVGIGDSNNGFFIGVNGSNGFGVMYRNNGVDTWQYQDSFSIDTLQGTGPLDFTIDETTGNVFQIQYKWLGYGRIVFAIETPDHASFQAFTVLQFANIQTNPSIQQPSLPLCAFAENTTNNTDIILRVGSMFAAVEGIRALTGITRSIDGTTTGVTTQTNVLTIRSKTIYNGQDNRIPIVPKTMSFILEGSGNKTGIIRLIRDVTLTTPSYTDIDVNNSPLEYDTAGTYTLTSGRQIATFIVGFNQGQTVDLFPYNIELNPNETLTITSESGTTHAPTVSITWLEDH